MFIRVTTSVVQIGGRPCFISSKNLLKETDRGPITLLVRQLRIDPLKYTTGFLHNLMMRSDRESIGVLSLLKPI